MRKRRASQVIIRLLGASKFIKDKAKGKEIKMERMCGNCVFCLIGIDGERLCSLASNEYVTKDEDNEWIAGRLVHPEDECIYLEDSGYASFIPVEAGVDLSQAYPGWCRKPDQG